MSKTTLTTGLTTFTPSDEGRRLKIVGTKSKLYVTYVQGSWVHLVKPSLPDLVLGRIFGWWR